jgi:16S rRNA (cytosine967-C5)-methyltransferase
LSDPTRTSAFDLLVAVAERRLTLEDALDELPPMESRDRAAARRIATIVLRRQGTLDAIVEPFLTRRPPDRALLVLRIGAAGLLLLGTPPHAAVDTAVGLARARKLDAFAGMINAILRRVAAKGASALAELDGPRLDTPAWLWTSWGTRARPIAAAIADEAPLDLTCKPGTEPPDGATLLPNGSARLPAGTRPAELTGFESGRFWVQDAAASMPARLLDARPGERVADLCAAPGGKTAQLLLTGASVTALDRDPNRLRRLSENMARLRLEPTLVEADLLAWRPDRPFDAILLDAPCSATGTARRHPELLRLRRPTDPAELAERQFAMVRAAHAMLRPGGRLVYAVCSLQPEEGPDLARRILADGDWTLSPIRPDELPGFEMCLTDEGTLKTDPGYWPELGGMDGFFAARLVRP